MNQTNHAAELRLLTERLASCPVDVAMWKAWAMAAYRHRSTKTEENITPYTGARAILRATELVRALSDQLSNVSGLNSLTREAPLGKLYGLCDQSLVNISNHWGAASGNLDQGVQMAIVFWSQMPLPLVPAIDDEALTALLAALIAEKDRVGVDENLSELERGRLLRVLMGLIDVVLAYGAGGARAMQSALRDWIALVQSVYGAEARPTEAESVVVATAWSKFKATCDVIIYGDALISAIERAGGWIKAGVPLLGGP